MLPSWAHKIGSEPFFLVLKRGVFLVILLKKARKAGIKRGEERLFLMSCFFPTRFRTERIKMDASVQVCELNVIYNAITGLINENKWNFYL